MPSEKRIRVTRTLVIEGPEAWVRATLNKSLVAEGRRFLGPERFIEERSRVEEELPNAE